MTNDEPEVLDESEVAASIVPKKPAPTPPIVELPPPPLLEVALPPPPPIDVPLAPPPPIDAVAMPVPVPVAPVDFAVPNFQTRKSRPLLGPALWIFGALLWAFIVVGQLVVERELPEILGLLALFTGVGLNWVEAVDPGSGVKRSRWRKIAPGLLALAFWLVCMFMAMVMGGGRTANAGIPLALWLLSAFAIFFGRRLTARIRPPRTKARRALVVGLWAVTVIATAVALLPILAN